MLLAALPTLVSLAGVSRALLAVCGVVVERGAGGGGKSVCTFGRVGYIVTCVRAGRR
jgi:hypothetical protein